MVFTSHVSAGRPSPTMTAALLTHSFWDVFPVGPSRQKPSVTVTSPRAPSKSLRHHMRMFTFLSEATHGGKQKHRNTLPLKVATPYIYSPSPGLQIPSDKTTQPGKGLAATPGPRVLSP